MGLFGNSRKSGKGGVAKVNYISEVFISTANQSVFTLTKGTYTVGAGMLNVFVDGILQMRGENYTETSNKSFTLSESLPAGIDVYAEWYNAGVDIDISELKNYKTKVEDKVNSVSAQLAEKAQLIDLSKIQSATHYGEITYPAGFPVPLVKFYRDFDGRVKHNHDFNQYKTGYSEIYVNSTTGNDTSGDGTSGLPFRSMQKAIDVAEAGAGSSYIIKVMDSFLNRSYSGINKTITKNISIVGNGTSKVTLSTANSSLSWTADGAGTWKATRSTVYSVFDLMKTDVHGEFVPLQSVATLAECQAQAGTWYTDDVTVWIHTSDGLMPTITTHAIGISVNQLSVNITNNAKLYLENIRFLVGRNSNATFISGDSNVQGTFVANNCSFVGGYLRKNSGIIGNALSMDNVKNTYLFNCICAYSGRDGFNYHYTNIPTANRRDCLVVEYNCLSYNNGLNDTNGNNNCTTCHEGASILRIGSIGYKSTGPILADVNGCYSIAIDCHMRDSLLTTGNTKSAFYFDNTLATLNGKAYLYNCGGGGDNYSLNTDTNFEVIARNFRGRSVPSTVFVTIID